MYIYLLLAECEVCTASYGPSFFLPFMAQVRSARAMKTRKKKRGSITCCMDRANEANEMFIIWLCCLFRFWEGDWELEVRTATYGPGIDQSQHAKSVSHIIIIIIIIVIIIIVDIGIYTYYHQHHHLLSVIHHPGQALYHTFLSVPLTCTC